MCFLFVLLSQRKRDNFPKDNTPQLSYVIFRSFGGCIEVIGRLEEIDNVIHVMVNWMLLIPDVIVLSAAYMTPKVGNNLMLKNRLISGNV